MRFFHLDFRFLFSIIMLICFFSDSKGATTVNRATDSDVEDGRISSGFKKGSAAVFSGVKSVGSTGFKFLTEFKTFVTKVRTSHVAIRCCFVYFSSLRNVHPRICFLTWQFCTTKRTLGQCRRFGRCSYQYEMNILRYFLCCFVEPVFCCCFAVCFSLAQLFLAVGGAFKSIVDSFAQDILMPPIGLAMQTNFVDWFYVIRLPPKDANGTQAMGYERLGCYFSRPLKNLPTAVLPAARGRRSPTRKRRALVRAAFVTRALRCCLIFVMFQRAILTTVTINPGRFFQFVRIAALDDDCLFCYPHPPPPPPPCALTTQQQYRSSISSSSACSCSYS
jgi:hypothetical protein